MRQYEQLVRDVLTHWQPMECLDAAVTWSRGWRPRTNRAAA